MNLFRRELRIARFCRQSGWLLCNQEGHKFQVCSGSDSRGCYVMIRDNPNRSTVVFQSWFPVQFPLDSPPSGLFARLLLRNLDLHYACWEMTIHRQCEAALCVAAQVPSNALDVSLFDCVCREVTDEFLSFHQELRDKFRYGAGFPPSQRVAVRPEPCPTPIPSWTERLRQLR